MVVPRSRWLMMPVPDIYRTYCNNSNTFQVSKKYVSKELSEQIHKKADPFIKWLKEAEEETSEEDEDEVELEFDDRAKISALQVRLHTSSI